MRLKPKILLATALTSLAVIVGVLLAFHISGSGTVGAPGGAGGGLNASFGGYRVLWNGCFSLGSSGVVENFGLDFDEPVYLSLRVYVSGSSGNGSWSLFSRAVFVGVGGERFVLDGGCILSPSIFCGGFPRLLYDLPLRLGPGSYNVSLAFRVNGSLDGGLVGARAILYASKEPWLQPRVLVPAYYYPSLWEESSRGSVYWRETLGKAGSTIIVFNPNNGPGGIQDRPYYLRVLREALSRGALAVGYVYTKYGERPLSKVLEDINGWLQMYPMIQGFFIDETPTDPGKTGYYANIYSYIKQIDPGLLVILNPGTPPSQAYNSVADMIVVYEDSIEHAGDLDSLLHMVSREYRNPAIIIQGVKDEKTYRRVVGMLKQYYGSLAALYIYEDSSNYDRPSEWLESLAKETRGPSRTARELSNPIVSISIVGPRPKNTTGWRIGENSTRTTTMMIDPNTTYVGENTYKARIWVWHFNPQEKNGEKQATIIVENPYTNTTYTIEKIKLYRQEPYSQALIEIKMRPGEYLVAVKIDHTELTGELTAPNKS